MSLLCLPLELLSHVGSFCDSPQLASLALVNHRFYDIFNPHLYRHNAFHDEPSKASVIWAAGFGSLKTLKLAIAQGADINTTGAASEDVVWQTVVDDPRTRHMYAAPLHLAIYNDHEDILRWLLENNARLDVPSLNCCDCDRPEGDFCWYPLHFAICHSTKASTLDLLLKHGAFWAAKGLPGIACAIAELNLPAIDAILQLHTFEPKYRDEDGETAFHYVSLCEDLDNAVEITHKLIDYGVPLDVIATEGTALNVMVRDRKFKCAIALLERGADPTAGGEEDGRGLGIIDRIFDEDYAAEIDFDESSERFARAEERRQDRRKLLELVIAGGADVNRVLGRGNPPLTRPLYWALVVSKDVECLKLLLDAGARIEDAFVYYEGDSQGLLRAFFNAETGYLSMDQADEPSEETFEPYKDSVKLLLEKGARIDTLDEDRSSALDEACDLGGSGKGIWEIEFLVEHATSRNVSAEYIETFMEEFRDDENEVYPLLEQLHAKLVNESQDRPAAITREN
ncbi:hypothetical protein FGRMN_6372 [Fusarium graminum]|nr:hypothetical protein FGRMN_6372 [Fusarium graminum]